MALSPQGNLAIGVSAESENIAASHLREARSAFLPDIEGSFTVDNQLLNLAIFGLQNVQLPIEGFNFPKSSGEFTTIDARIHLKQDVFDRASRLRSMTSQAEFASAKTETAHVRDAVVAEVASLYYADQRSAAVVETEQELVALADSTLKDVTARQQQGKALELDVAHAKTERAVAQQALLQAQLQKSKVDLEFLSSLNQDLEKQVELTEPLTFQDEETLTPKQAVVAALGARSDYLAQKQTLEALQLKAASISSERIPTVNAFADAGSLGTTLPNSIGTYDVGVTLRVPIFDSQTRNPRRAEAEAEIHRQKLRLAQLQNQIELEVIEAVYKIGLARGEVQTLQSEVDTAEQELLHRQHRFDQGLAVQLEVTEAREGLVHARDGKSQALYDWNQARINLMQAMGTIEALVQ